MSVSSKQKTGSLVVKMRVHGDKLIPIAEQPVTTDVIPFKFASETNTVSIGDTITGVDSDSMMSDKYDSYDDELEMDMPESTDKQKVKETGTKASDTEEQAIEVKTESIDPDEDDNDLVNNLTDLVGENKKKKMLAKINSHGKPSKHSARCKAGVDKTKTPGIGDGTRDDDLIEDVSDLVSIIIPRCEKTCLRRLANTKDADQPAHPRSLISVFVIRCLESTISELATSEISIF